MFFFAAITDWEIYALPSSQMNSVICSGSSVLTIYISHLRQKRNIAEQCAQALCILSLWLLRHQITYKFSCQQIKHDVPRPFIGPMVTHMILYGRSISIRKGVKNDAFFLFTSRIFFGHRKNLFSGWYLTKRYWNKFTLPLPAYFLKFWLIRHESQLPLFFKICFYNTIMILRQRPSLFVCSLSKKKFEQLHQSWTHLWIALLTWYRL